MLSHKAQQKKQIFFFSFLFILIFIVVIFSCTTTKETTIAPTHPQAFSILQGLSWDQGAYFSILRDRPQQVAYFQVSRASDNSQKNVPRNDLEKNISEKKILVRTIEHPPSTFVVDQIKMEFPLSIEKLTQQNFSLEVRNLNGQLLDRRQVARPSLNKSEFKIAIASCMDDRWEKEQKQMWEQLVSEQPEYLFMLGDNVYATSRLLPGEKYVSPRQLWDRYVEMRQKLAIYFSEKLIPTLAQWDDHDYGMPDGNKTYPFRQESKDIFAAFFPQPPVLGIFSKGPAHSYLLKGFGGKFYFLDDRSEREPNGQDSGQYAHLGKAQEQWLMDELKKTSLPSWLLMGNQFFGGYHSWESFEGNHTKSFTQFLKSLRSISLPLLFISGDRHLTEISRIDPPELNHSTYELTSSPIHARTHPSRWNKTPNRRQLVGKDLKINYMVLQGQHFPSGIHLKAVAKSSNQEILFSRDLEIKTHPKK